MTAGDQASVSVLVRVPQDEAFRVFTEEIDRWWRHGRAYRIAKGRSVIHLEPQLGGRLFEAFGEGPKARILETGKITAWEPPSRFVLDWRAVNFKPSEKTEVEVLFAPSPSGTLVTVKHRGWSQIRPDHPARHEQDVPSFLRTLGMWWGAQMSSLRHCCEQLEER